MYKNTNTSYGSVAKFFHWFMAIMVICLLIIGYQLKSLGIPSLYQIHKAIGFLFLILVLIRLLWRMFNITPGYDGLKLPRGMILASTIVHYVLYSLMIIAPLSAFISSNASQRPVSFLFLFDMPSFFAQKNMDIANLAMEVHKSSVFILGWLVALHFSAALYHHFIRKDFILNRMLPFGFKLSHENKLIRMLLPKIMKD